MPDATFKPTYDQTNDKPKQYFGFSLLSSANSVKLKE